MNFQISAISPRTVLGELNRTLVKLSFAILTFLLGFILGKIVERVVYKVLKEIELNNLIKNSTGLRLNADHIISHILSYTIYFLSLVAALEQIGLANTILYLLSAAAIAIILISFFLAIRDFIPNVMAGFYLYTKENLKDGKFVEIDDIKGELIKIDLLQVRIQTKNGDVLHIPNSAVIKSKIKIRKRKP